MSAVLDLLNTTLRPMNIDDIDAVMAVERRVYRYPWTEGIFRDCLHVGYCCWVLDLHGEIAAYGVMSVAVEEAHVLNLCVKPEVQGCGLGQRMLSYLMDLACQHHAKTVFLEVRPSNTAALKLYHKLGFHEIGTRKAYYPANNGREDALILAHELGLE